MIFLRIFLLLFPALITSIFSFITSFSCVTLPLAPPSPNSFWLYLSVPLSYPSFPHPKLNIEKNLWVHRKAYCRWPRKFPSGKLGQELEHELCLSKVKLTTKYLTSRSCCPMRMMPALLITGGFSASDDLRCNGCVDGVPQSTINVTESPLT